jgi:hypothetical protein
MRWAVLVLVALVVVGCGPKDDAEKGAGGAPTSFAAAQGIVDGVAARHANLRRLTLHAIPTKGSQCTQIASTMPERRGKPSDAEDLEALRTGKEVVLDEDGAVDVTVPIRFADGKPTAVAGVTLALEEGGDREGLVSEARAIAKDLEGQIASAGRPLW